MTYRTPVIAAVRRLHRQRLRAVAACRTWRAARVDPAFATGPTPRTAPEFWPYLRDPDTLARPWACPARRGWSTGSAAWRRRTARARSPTTRPTTTAWSGCARPRSTGIPVPDVEVDDPTGDAELLVLGWGSTYGPIGAALPPGAQARASRSPTAHLRHLNPLPANLGDVLRRYRRVARARDEPGPARDAAAREVPRRRAATPRSRACRSSAEELQDVVLAARHEPATSRESA